jgi:hypothetical protein
MPIKYRNKVSGITEWGYFRRKHSSERSILSLMISAILGKASFISGNEAVYDATNAGIALSST